MTNRMHGTVYSDSFIISVPNIIVICEGKKVEFAYSVLTQSTQCAHTASFEHLQSIAV